MSNVSVTNETIAARRLFPLRHIISMGVRKNFYGREKTFCVIDFRRIPAGCRPRDDRAVRRTAGERTAPKLLHPEKQGGERLIVCARRAKKHAGRAGHVMRAFFCLSPGNLRRLGDAVVQKLF